MMFPLKVIFKISSKAILLGKIETSSPLSSTEDLNLAGTNNEC